MVERDKDLREGAQLIREVACLQVLAYLCQRLGGFLDKPIAEQTEFLEALGVPPVEARHVLKLLRQLPELMIPVNERLKPEDRPSQGCTLGWAPSVLAPVFYGIQDVEPWVFAAASLTGSGTDAGSLDSFGPPGKFRIFYPSIDGAPKGAPLLEGCGTYPLVMLLHGQCDEPDHYLKWHYFPIQLARCGYVVVVPRLKHYEYPWGDQNSDLDLTQKVLNWMRSQWSHRDHLMPPPATAIVGHSYGALLGAHLVRHIPALAYVSMSGVWLQWPSSPPLPLKEINVPSLFMWGSGGFDVVEASAQLTSGLWNQVKRPKHQLVFDKGHHWDYLRRSQSTCGERDFSGPGPCDLVGYLAADFTTLFLSNYMPSEAAGIVPGFIPDSLLPPSIPLTVEQQFFSAGHLAGLSLISLREACIITHSWENAQGQTGSIVLPD